MEEKNDISLSAFKEAISKLPGEEKEIALTLLEKIGFDWSSTFDSLTGTKVIGYTIGGETFKPDGHHHRDVLRKILENISQRFPNHLEKLFALKGKKRKYFSRDINDIRDPGRIKGTNIYFEMNDNSDTLRARCKKVLKLYGFDTSTFKIITY